MDSYMESHYNDDTNNNETQEQPNIGLLRFRSAPTTIFDDVTIQNGYSGLGLGSGSGGLPPQYPKPTMVRSSSRSMRKEVVKESRKQWSSNIDRQTTSPPAAFFHCLNSRRGYNMMRGIGNFSGNGTHTESTNRLPMSHLPQISLIEAENVKETGSKGIYFGNNGEGVGETGSSFSYPYENGELATPHNVLVHHFSLPRTSAEITAAEKLMHFQDTVPWKIRAKRGYATHPRSIAERVRRNRISEKMRKLQCLVPSMDKQTNTADMLDLAVNYIRNLQDQYKVLSNVRARCKCVHLLE